MYTRLTVALASLVSLTACASGPVPTEHLASSMAAVRGAQEAGAERVPEAALHLKLAQDQIAQAKNMIENGDNARADRMAIRAYNDAELANAMARNDAVTKRLEAYRAVSAGGSAEGVQAAEATTPSPTPKKQSEARVDLESKE